MENHQKRIEAAYLTKCSAQAAYDWLQERQIKDIYEWCTAYHKTLEYLLLKRNEPLIDLGIARYGHSDKAITTVYRRGDTGTKCAVLGNPHIGYTRCNGNIFGYGSSIVYSAIRGSNAELESLLKNPNLREKVIEDLLGRKELFEGKSDDEFIQMIRWLGQNPRMRLDFDYTRQRLDVGVEYHHYHVFFLAWGLAETLPTTQEFAIGLWELLSGTKCVSSTTFKDFQSVMDRWRIEEGANDGKPNYYPSYYLRARIADLAQPKDNMLESNDFAERESFYRRFSPYEFKNWPSFIERDGINAFAAIVHNDNLWMHEEFRKTLKDVAWNKVPDHGLDAGNEYNAVKKNCRKKHPNWFLEEDLRWSGSTEAIIRRLGKNLEEQEDQKDIIETLEKFSESVSEQLESNKDKLENEIRSSRYSIDTVQDKVLRRIDEALEKALQNINSIRPIPPKPVAIWPWFIVIGLLIAILLK
jgi:hypothetical protein